MEYSVLMPWCNPCRGYHSHVAPGCFNRKAFDAAYCEATQALWHFWLVHAALMRTLERKP